MLGKSFVYFLSAISVVQNLPDMDLNIVENRCYAIIFNNVVTWTMLQSYIDYFTVLHSYEKFNSEKKLVYLRYQDIIFPTSVTVPIETS